MAYEKAKQFSSAEFRSILGKLLSSGAVISGGALAFNATETRRMAWAIEQGEFKPRKLTPIFAPDLCPFKLDQIRTELNPTGIVSIIGHKSLGKTTCVQYALSIAQNPLYVEMTDGNAIEAIYRDLKAAVWRLPEPLDSMRLYRGQDHKKLVYTVFQIVKQDTHSTVQLGFDIQSNNDFVPKEFVREMKHLCADARLASAIFATSEGLMMLDVAEPRMRVHIAPELSVEKAKEFLKSVSPNLHYDSNMLTDFPRTFANLVFFSETADKHGFCKAEGKRAYRHMRMAVNKIPKAKQLIELALQRGSVDVDEISPVCGVEDFVATFVKTSIFRPLPDGSWALHFDCTKKAALSL
mmetsp:Transcript_4712/g.11179  ORF Transcript_4712/g.11179 Transcript_4712/m.11179 type:complete len:352 (+) Transcript_4712:104-1159(+)